MFEYLKAQRPIMERMNNRLDDIRNWLESPPSHTFGEFTLAIDEEVDDLLVLNHGKVNARVMAGHYIKDMAWMFRLIDDLSTQIDHLRSDG